MSTTTLVIVESPTKVPTIKGFLGKGYKVVSSKGHVRDLPKSKLGIDVEHDFEPKYINIRGKGELINALKKEAKNASKVLLATDPDREGEAISWHLAALLNIDLTEKNRVTFNEITKSAVKESLKHAREIDMNLVDAQQAKQLKMELFLAIGQSSDSPCSVVVLRYMGNPDDKEVTALVGKGVTMDTGGYSLKSGKGMAAMKSDMGGAASVAAAVCALARNQAKTNVVAVIPIVENRLSNSACTPGDVLTAMNGKTVEILSTDAEGRLILADALTYAVREEKADRVIDVATLTGAIVQAYGSVRAGVMTNDDLFEDELLRAAARAGEKFVDLPTDEEYFEIVKGDITDLVNSSRAGCGSIVAGLFLREFCEQRPWMHLDIAGTAWLDKAAHEYDGKGATGSPTATLYFLLDRHFTAADRF